MSDISRHPKCEHRTELGNCLPIGGFCTAVPTSVCEAERSKSMYEALYVGYDDGGIQDEAVITVMRKNLNGSVEAVKILIGKEAESLHKVLTEQTVNFTIKEQEHE